MCVLRKCENINEKNWNTNLPCVNWKEKEKLEQTLLERGYEGTGMIRDVGENCARKIRVFLRNITTKLCKRNLRKNTFISARVIQVALIVYSRNETKKRILSNRQLAKKVLFT